MKFSDFTQSSPPAANDWVAGFLSAGGAGSNRRFRASEIFEAASNIGIGIGALTNAGIIYAGTVTPDASEAVGLQLSPQFAPVTCGSVYGIALVGNLTNGSVTYTNLRAFRAETWIKGGSVTVTNAYSIWIDPQTIGSTLNRSLYVAGGTSEFDGFTIIQSLALGTTGTDPGTGNIALPAGAQLNWNSGAVTLTESSSNIIISSPNNGGLIVQNTNAGSFGAFITLDAASGSPAASDIAGHIFFAGRDTGSPDNNSQNYGEISVTIGDPTAGSEDSTMTFSTLVAGAASNWSHGFGAIWPASDGAMSVGLGGVGWGAVYISANGFLDFGNNDVRFTHSTDLVTVSGGGIVLAAGTTSFAPLKFNSGTNTTSPLNGMMEFDGQALFFTPDDSDRRIIPAMAVIRQHATFTLTSTTSYQKLFNGSANGAIVLQIGTYYFEAMVSLNTMSATSGNAAFSVAAGTATITNSLIAWHAIDAATTGSGGAAFQSGMVRSNQTGATTTNMATAAVTTEMQFWVRGSFEVSVAGTVIPSISLQTANAAVVQIGSYFMAWRAGADTLTNQGNWS